MKANLIILSSLLVFNIFCFEYKELVMNEVNNFGNNDEELRYFKVPLKNSELIPSEIKIETSSTHEGMVGVHYEPFKMKNYENILKAELGKPIILNTEFIKSALEKGDQIYLTVFCEKCEYKLKVLPGGEMKPITNFVQAPPIRKLAQEGAPLQAGDTPSQTDRIYFFIADGISALFVAFIMIFVSLIGCLIMMNIYVHNTALVEQPLKLGRIEA
jgi:hypothetical protein